jgi:putative hydrolase of the HAD superfamily
MCWPFMKSDVARTPGSAVAFTDADNTLWDTNAVFATAQLRLLDRVESATGIICPSSDRLKFVRHLDQLVAASHHANLKYPPRILAAALALTLLGQRPDRAARQALLSAASSIQTALDVESAEVAFLADLQEAPKLRPGVSEGLKSLGRANIEVIVITEGNKAKCEKLIAHHAIAPFVSRVLEGTKRPELYKRAMAWAGERQLSFMVGDQLDRDIVPAKQAGVATVYFPSDFRPHWAPAEAEVRPDLTVASFLDAAEWIISEAVRHTHMAGPGRSIVG